MRYLSNEDRYLEKELNEHLAKLISNMTPTLLLTMTLFAPYKGASNYTIFKKYGGDLSRMHREVINRLDRIIYGTRHHNKRKFPYLFRIETIDKKGQPIQPHIHCLMGMDLYDRDQINLKRDKLERQLGRLCEQNNFLNNIDIRPHCTRKSDYIAKFPICDVLNIHERGLI